MSAPSVALLDGDDAALFPKLTEEQLGLLAPLGHVREVDVDDVLFRDGDAGYDPMVVLAGRVAVRAGRGAPEGFADGTPIFISGSTAASFAAS